MAAPAVTPAVVVVAIDFGTSRSGYAWTLTAQARGARPGNAIVASHPWFGGMPGQKTRTAVLLEAAAPHACVAFGDAAADEYFRAESERRAQLMYFDKFKMCLYRPQVGQTPKVTCKDGRELDAVVVFGAALGYIRRVAVERLQAAAMNLRPQDFRWVLSVPAIWSDAAKEVMRKAAALAGLPESQTLLCLEPEAASILARDEFQQTNPGQLPTGTQYMVLDCGGGTIDVTVHETLEPRPPAGAAPDGGPQGQRALVASVAPVKEVHRASGGDWGSTYIDLAFERVLQGIFTAERLRAYRSASPSDWLKILDSFEGAKVSMRPAEEGVAGARSRVALRMSFVKAMERACGSSMEEVVDAWWAQSGAMVTKLAHTLNVTLEARPIKWDDEAGDLCLSHGFMLTLMLPVIQSVASHTLQLLASKPDVRYVFLVGGFAECPLLFERIKLECELPGRRTVLMPPFPSIAVLRGAVMYGLDPGAVRERISQLTYGVGCMSRWDDSLYGPADLWRREVDAEGDVMCRNAFSAFVHVNQSVPLNHCVERTYFANQRHDESVVVNLYSSALHSPRFADTECRHSAKISIPLPRSNTDAEWHTNRKIKVKLFFGGTEIRFEVTTVSGETRNIPINFACV